MSFTLITHHDRLMLLTILVVAVLFAIVMASVEPMLGLDDAVQLALDIKSSCTHP